MRALCVGRHQYLSDHISQYFRDAGLATVAAGNLLAFAAALPQAIPVGAFHARDAAVLLYLGVAQIGLAYWCLTRGLGGVPAFEAITTLQLEVAMNPVWTWLMHGERPGARSIAGGLMIVCATLVNTWRSSRSAVLEHSVRVATAETRDPVIKRSQG
jgi:drug/metabolite transporter (DMT)-like permease